MKIIKITNKNINEFTEHMFSFNCANSYNEESFSASDIERDLRAHHTTGILLEQLDEAGFDLQSAPTFERHDWNVSDYASPNTDNPVLFVSSSMYEAYFDYRNITDYYVEKADADIFALPA